MVKKASLGSMRRDLRKRYTRTSTSKIMNAREKLTNRAGRSYKKLRLGSEEQIIKDNRRRGTISKTEARHLLNYYKRRDKSGQVIEETERLSSQKPEENEPREEVSLSRVRGGAPSSREERTVQGPRWPMGLGRPPGMSGGGGGGPSISETTRLRREFGGTGRLSRESQQAEFGGMGGAFTSGRKLGGGLGGDTSARGRTGKIGGGLGGGSRGGFGGGAKKS